jgi:DNA transposition AAA+ family ATPase
MGITTDTMLETTTLDEVAVRSALWDAQRASSSSWTDIAKEAGVAYSTLMAWKDGKYKGDNDGNTAKIAAWLTTRAAQEETRVALRTVPGFQATKTARRIADLLQEAQMLPSMSMITGGAGVGKTSAIRAYRARMSNVFIVTCEPFMTTVSVLLTAVGEVLGITAFRSSQDLARMIKLRLRDANALLIFDDVQHLSSHLLDQVRHIHDGAEVGIALVGNRAALGRIGADKRVELYAPLYSRVSSRNNFNKPLKSDISTVLDAWGLDDKTARETALGIGLKPGGQRVLKMVMLKAFALAGAGGGTQPNVEQIELVWMQLANINEEGAA